MASARYSVFMAVDLKRLLEDALTLPQEARAALAGQLLGSLDAQVDENAAAEWSQEIARRLAEIDSGAVKAIPWNEAKKAIRRSK